jgi:hypothetical protein
MGVTGLEKAADTGRNMGRGQEKVRWRRTLSGYRGGMRGNSSSFGLIVERYWNMAVASLFREQVICEEGWA